MAEASDFETSGLHWKVEWPSDVMELHGDRLMALRHNYYWAVLLGMPGTGERFADRSGGKNWVRPNRTVGKYGINKGQRWSHHRVVTAYDKHNQLQGFVDLADNASASTRFPKRMVGPFIRAAKLHIPTKSLLSSRYGNIREIIGGEGREGFEIVASALAVKALCRTEQGLSGYPWDREHTLKRALGAIGLHRNEERETKPVDLGFGYAVKMEPWVADRAGDADLALSLVPGAAEAVENALDTLAE